MNDGGLQTVSDIPKVWRDLFNIIREALPGTIMAGGCLRDRDMSVKVNDIDLFVPEATGKWEDLTAVEAILRQLGADQVEIMNDKVYPKGVDNHIVGVVEAKFVSCPLKLQLVIGDWGKTMDDLFMCFDYGICMITYDGKEIHRHPNYWTDRKAKQFRICARRSREAFHQSVERYARLKQKYPDWKFNLGHLYVDYGGHSGGVVSGEFHYATRDWPGSIAAMRPGGEAIRPKRAGDITAHIDYMGVTTAQQAGLLSRKVQDTILRYVSGKPDVFRHLSSDD